MAETDFRSLQQIKRETEQTRAGLTHTVEELKTSVADTASDIRRRISPDAIKAEVSGYFKSRGEQLLNDITDAARRNPMQAVAVGATVGYPLLRLVRTIPVPVLMVGAGLFLAGSRTGQAFTQKASDAAADLSDEVARRARELGDQAGESVSAATSYASDQFDRMKTTASDASDQVSRAAGAAAATVGTRTRHFQDKAESMASSVAGRAGDLGEQAANLRDEGVRMASSAAATVQDIASGATSAASDAAAATADAGLDAVRTARDRAAELTDRAGKTIFQTIEQNPLLVAGVGLLIGGLIASALPRTEMEDELLGDTSTAVKRRAQAAASDGFDAAKEAVGETYDATARQAEAEGLTPDGLGKAAQDVGQRVRRVAEAAVTTAFEPNQDTNQVNAHGGKDNG